MLGNLLCKILSDFLGLFAAQNAFQYEPRFIFRGRAKSNGKMQRKQKRGKRVALRLSLRTLILRFTALKLKSGELGRKLEH